MNSSELKESIKGGLARDHFDGVRHWSRKSVEGMINPRGCANSLSDPEVIQMLNELESEGFVRILGRDDRYLEILKSPL